MKIKKSHLKQLIKESVQSVFKEQSLDIKFDNIHLDVVGENEHKFKLVAKMKNKIVGKIEYALVDDVAHIEFINVDPKFQKQGIGTALMKKIVELYGAKNIIAGMTTDSGEKLLKSIEKDFGPLGKEKDEIEDINLSKSIDVIEFEFSSFEGKVKNQNFTNFDLPFNLSRVPEDGEIVAENNRLMRRGIRLISAHADRSYSLSNEIFILETYVDDIAKVTLIGFNDFTEEEMKEIHLSFKKRNLSNDIEKDLKSRGFDFVTIEKLVQKYI